MACWRLPGLERQLKGGRDWLMKEDRHVVTFIAQVALGSICGVGWAHRSTRIVLGLGDSDCTHQCMWAAGPQSPVIGPASLAKGDIDDIC